jgi:hypothetical protein
MFAPLQHRHLRVESAREVHVPVRTNLRGWVATK